jgi:uncharacterized protein (TIGR00251 family)
MDACPWSAAADGVVLTVRLTPKGGRDAVDGIERLSDGRAVLKVRVRAAPAEGEANAALVALLAKTLKIAPRQVDLVAGATARIKRIKIEGDAARIAGALERLTGTSSA